MSRTNFTTPVGRLLMGSLYKPQTTDADGKPLVVKSGPNTGQPKVTFFFALGIPKGTEQHWAQTEWGAKIWATGHAAFPKEAQSPAFAWKIVDGDSQVPNKKGSKPCDREGHRGHWVLHFSSGFAPKIYNRDGTQAITGPDAVKLGYYVQVNCDVDGNDSTQNPGVFLNHVMVALSAYGTEIVVGPDPTAAGFGAAALPAGALAQPPATFNPAPPVNPTMPLLDFSKLAPPPAPTMPPAAPPPAAPNPAFLQVPGAPVPPAAPPIPPAAPPAPPVRQMTAKAAGASYESFISQGWNDGLLVQHGYMVA